MSDEEIDVRNVVRQGAWEPSSANQGNNLVTEGGLRMDVKFPLLQYVPVAWVPYFLVTQSPEAAMRTLRQLTDGNVTDWQRGHTAQLEAWMRAAWMRLGPIGANCNRSKLHKT